MTRPLTNWAGNVTFHAARVHRPTSVEELAQIVAGSARLRALGTGHSFSTVADTTGDLVSIADLPRSVVVDAGRATVTASAGQSYGELVTIGRGDADFPGAVVALGSLGVVTTVTLDVVPTFDVRQTVYDDLTQATVLDRFDSILDSAYSVSIFTDWRGDTSHVWRKDRVGSDDGDVEPDWLGATAATRPSHPVPGMDVTSATEQLGVPGPWHERLPHFRIGVTPSSGDELQSEYLVAREDGARAFEAVERIREQVAPALQVCEIRTVAADDLWLSMAQGRDSVAVHFTWVDDLLAATAAMRAVERALEPLGPRPHWGKLFDLPAEVVHERYVRLADFQRLRGRLDPTNKLGNDFVDHYLGDPRT